jgi:hypothetical protein
MPLQSKLELQNIMSIRDLADEVSTDKKGKKGGKSKKGKNRYTKLEAEIHEFSDYRRDLDGDIIVKVKNGDLIIKYDLDGLQKNCEDCFIKIHDGDCDDLDGSLDHFDWDESTYTTDGDRDTKGTIKIDDEGYDLKDFKCKPVVVYGRDGMKGKKGKKGKNDKKKPHKIGCGVLMVPGMYDC